ncbi:thermonuclease family protein [Roseospira goensis]|uniref:Endonuclease YncB(Thermonuclease family) n=1 Tax=Roseospira goensis TaxID=391922 RepID=A0A7W6WKB3_9PROT|nr:thermonuclease family protein [Roseospira goensis]MBB4285584.1 endonuclease YncB(thermonuclease family) [Roseospira goensis]
MVGHQGPTRRACLGLGVELGLGVGLLAAGVLARPAPAGGAPADGLTEAVAGRVRAVTGDGHLVLEDGRRVRLAGVRLPHPSDLPPGASPDERARVRRYAAAALAVLRREATGHRVTPWTPEVERDRYGRVLAQVTRTPGGAWIQARLIAAGLARVATMPGAAAGAAPLLRAEAAARLVGRGLWADPLYAPRAPGQTWPWLGTFQIVRGTVVDAAQVRSRVYLNFGPDWRRDFTIRVERPRTAGFDSAALLDLRRQYVQVRGWLFARNGPMIALDHPAALETRVTLG